MKTIISTLKKNDKFLFNGYTYLVLAKYSDWKKDGEPYMRAKRGFEESELFYFDELEVTKLINSTNMKKPIKKAKSKLSDYDTLECPYCDKPVKPSKINKDESVTYNCKNCENKFKISVDGDLIED